MSFESDDAAERRRAKELNFLMARVGSAYPRRDIASVARRQVRAARVAVEADARRERETLAGIAAATEAAEERADAAITAAVRRRLYATAGSVVVAAAAMLAVIA